MDTTDEVKPQPHPFPAAYRINKGANGKGKEPYYHDKE